MDFDDLQNVNDSSRVGLVSSKKLGLDSSKYKDNRRESNVEEMFDSN